ncbi:hypothetical protein NFJ02_01g38400 [Pycnococcus provasolii]
MPWWSWSWGSPPDGGSGGGGGGTTTTLKTKRQLETSSQSSELLSDGSGVTPPLSSSSRDAAPPPPTPSSFLGTGTPVPDEPGAIMYGNKWFGVVMRAPPPDDTPGQVEEREARIDADVEREHLGDWARAEREYAEQYGKCVLETSYKFCMMGLAAGIPLGIYQKSYLPPVLMGMAGSTFDFAEGTKSPKCLELQKEVEYIKMVRREGKSERK